MSLRVTKISLLMLFTFAILYSQQWQKSAQTELLMQQYNNKWFFTSSRVEPPNAIAAFVPFGGHSAFDNDSTTCWAEGIYGPGIGEEIWFSVPENPGYLTIINGFMKSNRNFKMSNRVGKIGVRLYLGMFVEGRDIDGERRFYLSPLTQMEEFKLLDIGSRQRFKLNYPYWQTINIKDKLAASFIREWKSPQSPKQMLFIRLRILSVYPGTLYDDTSISEIMVNAADLNKKVLRVYVNTKGDTLKMDTPLAQGRMVDSQQGGLFLLQEVSPDKDWAISLILSDTNRGNARHVLYYLPTAKRFETERIDKDCEELIRFKKERNQYYIVYRNKNDFQEHTLLLKNLK